MCGFCLWSSTKSMTHPEWRRMCFLILACTVLCTPPTFIRWKWVIGGSLGRASLPGWPNSASTESDIDELERILIEKSRMGQKIQSVWCECPNNPMLRTANLERVRKLADETWFHFRGGWYPWKLCKCGRHGCRRYNYYLAVKVFRWACWCSSRQVSWILPSRV